MPWQRSAFPAECQQLNLCRLHVRAERGAGFLPGSVGREQGLPSPGVGSFGPCPCMASWDGCWHQSPKLWCFVSVSRVLPSISCNSLWQERGLKTTVWLLFQICFGLCRVPEGRGVAKLAQETAAPLAGSPLGLGWNTFTHLVFQLLLGTTASSLLETFTWALACLSLH